jgi:hypothetical protein
MQNVAILYAHLEYFTAIWYNLWPFGIVCGHLVYVSHSGMFGPRKNLATLVRRGKMNSTSSYFPHISDVNM